MASMIRKPCCISHKGIIPHPCAKTQKFLKPTINPVRSSTELRLIRFAFCELAFGFLLNNILSAVKLLTGSKKQITKNKATTCGPARHSFSDGGRGARRDGHSGSPASTRCRPRPPRRNSRGPRGSRQWSAN